MPTTLTLKNIPDAVYARLKLSAEVHRRSLNGEAIVCLETVLLPTNRKGMGSPRRPLSPASGQNCPPARGGAQGCDFTPPDSGAT